MEVFSPIFNQMLCLFLFIAIGFILMKGRFVPDNADRVLSKLENLVLVPALVMGTFIKNCTIETLSSMWKLLVLGFGMVFLLIPLSFVCARICFKEKYLQKIATYGLAFSNFGFMGNAIMSAVFPNIFFQYTIFTLPFWFMIYMWGAPVLLIAGSNEGEKVALKQRLKSFVNPMFVGMLIGMAIGLTGFKLPEGVVSAIDGAGACMSPLAMILTGMTIGKTNVFVLLTKPRIYLTTFAKLVVYPLVFIVILFVVSLFPQNGFFNETFYRCATCVATMPLGLNTIVIPSAYGRDTTDAAGMALVSYLFSVATIPLWFMLMQAIIF